MSVLLIQHSGRTPGWRSQLNFIYFVYLGIFGPSDVVNLIYCSTEHVKVIVFLNEKSAMSVSFFI